jgi:LPS export ABC transporter protein LptC
MRITSLPNFPRSFDSVRSSQASWAMRVGTNSAQDDRFINIKRIKYWPIFVAFAFSCLLLIGCDEGPKVMPSIANAPISGADKPGQVSYNTSMNFSASGVLRAILHAGRVQTFETKRYTWLDSSVRVDFYNKDGLHSSVLTSRTARVNTTNNNMTAYEHVHIISDSGTTVDTDSLEWDNKSQTIHSDAPVHIVEKDGRVTDGIGFESDQSLEHYHIMRPIIVSSSDEFGARKSSSDNDLKPPTMQVPGAGAMRTAPLGVPFDSLHSKR